MALVSGVTTWWVWSDATRQVETRHQELTSLVIDRVGSKLRDIADQASTLASNDLLINGLIDVSSSENYLDTFFRSLDIAGATGAQISLTDYRGRVVASNFSLPRLQSPVSEWLDVVIGSHGFYRRLDERGLIVVMPVRYNGFTEGAVVIEYDAARVASLVDLSTFSTTAILIGPNNQVIYTSKPDFLYLGETIDSFKLGGWYHTENAMPLLKGVTILTAEPAKVALAPLYQTLFLLVPGMAAVIIIAIASTASAAMITSNEVGRLSKELLNLGAKGDLSARISPSGPIEMRSLSNSFNLMLDRLGRTTTSQAYLQSVISSVEEILIVVGQNGSIRTANPSAKQFIRDQGRDEAEPIAEIMNLKEDDSFLNSANNSPLIKRSYRTASGNTIWIQWRRTSFKEGDSEDRAAGMIITGTDITQQHTTTEKLKFEIFQRKSLEAELRQQALTDPLTGLSNRRAFLEQITRELSNCDRTKNSIGLLYIDIDYFKQINDQYGHAAGDEALRYLSRSLIEQCRQGDLICRLGGEEFAVLLCNFSPPSANQVAERIREAIADLSVEIDDINFSMTVSVGVVVREPGDGDLELMMSRADKALYFAKRTGRNRVATAQEAEQAEQADEATSLHPAPSA